MTRTPTGTREQIDGRPHLVLTRTYRAPLEDVWAAVSDPARMERWIGTYAGDPSSGRVEFRMTAEGDDVPVEPYVVESCRPPHHFAVHSAESQSWRADGTGEGLVWRLVLDLTEAGGVTTLTFAQTLDHPEAAEIAASVGPGWEYYLDRLAADLAGDGAATISWDDGYEGDLAQHYRDALS